MQTRIWPSQMYSAAEQSSVFLKILLKISMNNYMDAMDSQLFSSNCHLQLGSTVTCYCQPDQPPIRLLSNKSNRVLVCFVASLFSSSLSCQLIIIPWIQLFQSRKGRCGIQTFAPGQHLLTWELRSTEQRRLAIRLCEAII